MVDHHRANRLDFIDLGISFQKCLSDFLTGTLLFVAVRFMAHPEFSEGSNLILCFIA
jgi:hypothetical protein